jgi:uncharacterized phage protein (TIGR02218 family)
MPKSASTSLISFLASIGPTENPYIAELYTFTLTGGLVLRYTTADRDVVFGGTIWSAGTVQFQDPNNRALGHWKIGLDVDSWQVLATPRRVDPHSGAPWPDMVGSQPFLAAMYGGAFSGADVEVDYAFFSSPPSAGATSWSPIGTIEWFRGRVAECDVGQSAAVITLNDYRELLTLQMPRHLFQATCRFTLYGPGCGLSAASFAVNGSVAAGSSGGAIVSAIGAPGGSGTYALGRLLMTSGANDGFSRMVRAWGGGVLYLANPFYWPLSVGDSFTAYPGCDLTMASCTAFGNLINFGGTPFIPPPETAS